MLYTRHGKMTTSLKDLSGGKAHYNANTENTEKPVVFSKHVHQTKESLPSVVSAVFGVSRSVVYDLEATMLKAKNLTTATDLQKQSYQSEVAIRMGVGKGINRETTWLPLLVMRKPYSRLGVLLSRKRAEQNSAVEASLHQLAQIKFSFGFQNEGEYYAVTDCTVSYEYIPVGQSNNVNTVKIVYDWNEHRPYNPHRALSVCTLLVLVWAMLVSGNIWSGRGKITKRFQRRQVTLRVPKE
ncbi:hypothetical protein, conserved [Angomonas deanei]|uniref:Uncharacterized protein n=1 Tax=Angomonas deanei TaxID=59799 RepID=A0A7G2CN53_9TRYP|nr:hypothetical protein, conserved [Angomonas deanei]